MAFLFLQPLGYMKNALITYFEKRIESQINKISPISGGDISQAYKLETVSKNYFLKLNAQDNAINMFQAEKLGLVTIEKTKTIATPEVIDCDMFEATAFLLLEYIDAKKPSEKDFEKLGEQLARLHQNQSDKFGLDSENFIGSLKQSNTSHKDWTTFFTEERLFPQLQLAKTKGLLNEKEIPTTEKIHNTLSNCFHDIKPTLLHGDLWSGNFLISKEGKPYLIDPAIYYGHNEVDIAMTKLFGGFNEGFYEAYAQHIPFDHKTHSRMEIYQLYYLLVHLNLFGRSYYNSVVSILKKYF